MKKYLAIILSLCMLVCIASLVACDKNDTPTEAPTQAPTEAPTDAPTEAPTQPETEKITYSVKFVDYKNETVTSFSGVINLSNGLIVPVSRGEASFVAEKGTYDAEFEITSSDGYEFEEEYQFTEENNEAVISVYNKVTDTDKSFYASEYGAGYVNEGATYVKLRGVTGEEYEGERSFFIFKPQRDGIYKISVITDKEVSVGYHGGNVFNIFPHSLNEVVDNTVEVQFHKSSIGADSSVVCIIGLTTDGSAKDCILVVERIADMPITEVDYEWEIPEFTGELKTHRFTYQNKQVVMTNLDLMDENLTLVLGDDGYYRLGTANGPIVYVRLSASSDYFGVDPETGLNNVAAFSSMMENTRLCRYFYDEDGNFIKKESYNEIFNRYLEIIDQSGVYPLDEALEYVIKQSGEQRDWWNYKSDNNLYTMYGVDQPPVENAWLFAACTIEPVDTGVDADNALLVNPEGSSSLIGAGNTVYFNVNEKPEIAVTLTVNATEGISVVYGGEEYTPDEDGVITVEITEDKLFTIVGASDLADDVVVSYTYEYAE